MSFTRRGREGGHSPEPVEKAQLWPPCGNSSLHPVVLSLPDRDSDMRTTRSFWEKPATGQQWRGRGVRCGPPDSGPEKGGAGGLCASAGLAPPHPTQPCSSVGGGTACRMGITDSLPSTSGWPANTNHERSSSNAGRQMATSGAPRAPQPRHPMWQRALRPRVGGGKPWVQVPPRLCTAQRVTRLSTHSPLPEPQWPAGPQVDGVHGLGHLGWAD